MDQLTQTHFGLTAEGTSRSEQTQPFGKFQEWIASAAPAIAQIYAV